MVSLIRFANQRNHGFADSEIRWFDALRISCSRCRSKFSQEDENVKPTRSTHHQNLFTLSPDLFLKNKNNKSCRITIFIFTNLMETFMEETKHWAMSRELVAAGLTWHWVGQSSLLQLSSIFYWRYPFEAAIFSIRGNGGIGRLKNWVTWLNI